ncbi:MAG: hypothetical protein V1834_00450 [Candidatus Micrarchaeota archaeon]
MPETRKVEALPHEDKMFLGGLFSNTEKLEIAGPRTSEKKEVTQHRERLLGFVSSGILASEVIESGSRAVSSSGKRLISKIKFHLKPEFLEGIRGYYKENK